MTWSSLGLSFSSSPCPAKISVMWHPRKQSTGTWNHHDTDWTSRADMKSYDRATAVKEILSLLICNLICCADAFPECLCNFTATFITALPNAAGTVSDGWPVPLVSTCQRFRRWPKKKKKNTNIWKCFLQWGQAREGSLAASCPLEENSRIHT